MKLTAYLFKRFLPVFFGALIFFVLILELVDLLMNIWEYISNQISLESIIQLVILYLPKTVFFALPLSILFASAYTLSDMYAKKELIIIFSSGISLFRFVLPLLVFSIIMSFTLFYFDDGLVVTTYAQKNAFQNKILGRQKNENNTNVVIQVDGGKTVYSANYYDGVNKRITGFLVVQRREDASLFRIIQAPRANWYNDRWNLSEPTLYEFSGNQVTVRSSAEGLELSEPPETFKNNVVSVEEISAAKAREYIAYLYRTGLPTAEALSQYYKKYSFPFILFIVVFLSVGLSGKTQKNVLLVSLVLCVCAAVLFYVSQMVTMLLAKFGYISPIVGAWFPVLLFVLISVFLLKFART